MLSMFLRSCIFVWIQQYKSSRNACNEQSERMINKNMYLSISFIDYEKKKFLIRCNEEKLPNFGTERLGV